MTNAPDLSSPTPSSGEKPNSRRDARRRAMLDAATELFIEKGYGATSLGDVVKRSGGSLTTLYELFGNKAGLFKALVGERCLQVTAFFDDADGTEQPPEAALEIYGRALFGLVMSADAIAVVRLIVAEGVQFPELAELFFASGPDLSKQRVAAYIAGLAARGALSVAEPERAAKQFCDLILGGHHFRAILGLPVALPPEEVDRHIAAAVSTFLAAYRPPG